MGVIKKAIVLEDKLEAMFDYLPAMPNSAKDATYPVTFSYGTPKDLNAFLKHKHKAGSPYPLIWLLYPYVETHTKTHIESTSISLILAVQTNSSMQNKQRIDETYKKVLMPLYDNVVHCLTTANISNVEHKFKVVKHPNYSDDLALGGSHAGAFIWDALKVTFGIKIQDTCLKEIKF